MYLHGVILGLVSFLTIGIFHPIVIKAEYHFSEKIWPVFGRSISMNGIIRPGLSEAPLDLSQNRIIRHSILFFPGSDRHQFYKTHVHRQILRQRRQLRG